MLLVINELFTIKFLGVLVYVYVYIFPEKCKWKRFVTKLVLYATVLCCGFSTSKEVYKSDAPSRTFDVM